ncbi:MAG: SusC/RagA family TonB-linked outer membrane protein, partial [Bacteroidales bacterium]|nr:SusC/RagA family TonB-linked outer membrane protein [Bacteroidales bacterium]
MKLTSLFIFVTVFNVFGNTDFYGQTIDLDMKDVQLKDVISAIESQSEYFFLYSSKMIDVTSKVDILADSRNVAEVLNTLFRETDIDYNIKERQILLSKRESPSLLTVQQNVITGTVVSSTGEPLPGVNVTIKGTTVGVMTDIDGKYTLAIPSGAAIITFSFIGMQPQEVTIGSQRQIDVTLSDAAVGLDEIVVTALGIKREARTLGYATAAVAQDEISTVRTSSPMATLQGKISGVNISQLGTGPGGSTRIRIRGNSSFSGTNTPLIVVNGVPMDNTQFGSNSGGGFDNVDGGDGFNSINPDDIESMTVLKGAAAAALYGSRAKDGVLMVTTRQRGEGSGLGVSYNMNFTAATAIDYTDFQYEYGQGENGNLPVAGSQSGIHSFGKKIEPGMTNEPLFAGYTVPYVAVTDRYKQFYRTATNLANTISLSNSGANGGFDLSLSNTKNTSIIENSDFTRQNITLGFTQNISKYITVSGNVNYSHEYNRNAPQVGSNAQEFGIPYAVATAANTMPWDGLKEYYKDANGNEAFWSKFLPRTNPYWTMYEKFDNMYRDRLFGNLSVRLNLTDKIYVQGRLGQDYYARKRDYNNPTGTATTGAAPAGYSNGNYSRSDNWFRETNFDLLMGIQQNFGDIGLNATLGGNQMHRTVETSWQTATDFVTRGLYTIMNGRSRISNHSLTERAVNSIYGSAEFSYRNFLYFTATARNDWFSTLPANNRSILYPSGTLSFIFSEIISLPEWFTFGKARLSYAEVGDDNVDAYSNIQYFSLNNNLYPSSAGSVPLGDYESSTIANPDLRPLRVSEMEAGLDFRFFNGKIVFDIAYYDKLTKDQIVSATVSHATGFATRLINVGESRSKGMETALTVKPIETRNFTWTLSGNLSYNTSEVLKLGLTDADTMITIGNVREIVGQKLGQIFTYSQAVDANGNKIFNNGLPVRTAEQMSIGTNQPTWFGGITNTFDYKGIIFSALIDFKLGDDYMML